MVIRKPGKRNQFFCWPSTFDRSNKNNVLNCPGDLCSGDLHHCLPLFHHLWADLRKLFKGAGRHQTERNYLHQCNFPDIQQIHKLINPHFGFWAIKQLFSCFSLWVEGRNRLEWIWMWVDREWKKKRDVCLTISVYSLVRHQSIQTHTLAFISLRSLLEVIGKVEVKWAWIKFDQTGCVCEAIVY